MAESSFEYTPCPLQYYEFKHLDHKKNCPTYEGSFLTPGIQVNDLEKLHADLSLLRENVQNRIQLLTSEMAVLTDWQVKREYKRKHDTEPAQISGSRSSKSHPFIVNSPHDNAQAPPSKRTRTAPPDDLVGGSLSSKSSKKKGILGGKSKAPKALPTEPMLEDIQPQQLDSSLIRLKPETNDKFWSTVEPYCSDITEEDLRMLQDFGSANDSSLFEVPSLGPHFSTQWGVEDIEEEMRPSDIGSINTSANSDAESMLMEGVLVARNKTIPSGPLTQRLVSAFLEDPAGSNLPPSIPKSLSSTLPPISPTTLEVKLREELLSLGLIDPTTNESQRDTTSAETEDEVLRELEKAQAELRKVIDYNRQQKLMLHSLARAEMRRQDIRKKLQDTDSELMDTLRRFASYRQKKKREPISRKDREIAERILETRQRQVSQLLV